MPFGFGSGYRGTGDFGYGTLSASIDNGLVDGRSYHSHTMSTPRTSISGRPRIDRRYSPPPTSRHRAETGLSSRSIYSSLPSGLMSRKNATGKNSRQPSTRSREKTKKVESSRRSTLTKYTVAPAKSSTGKKNNSKKRGPPLEPNERRSSRLFSTSSIKSRDKGPKSKPGSTISRKSVSQSSKKAAQQSKKAKSGWACW